MSRRTMGWWTIVLAVALFACVSPTWAQGPGGGGPGGGGGGRGGRGGGPGGFGGPGFGPGNSLTGLVMNEAVQKELKLSDQQKTKLKQLDDKAQQTRRTLFQNMRAAFGNGQGGGPGGGGPGGGGPGGGGRGGRNGGGGPGNNAPNGGFGGGGPGGGFGGGFPGGGLPGGFMPGGTGIPGPGGMPLGPGGVPMTGMAGNNAPQNTGPDPRQVQRQAMMETMNQLQQQQEKALAQILTKPQFKRLKQIRLQSQGPNGFLQPEVMTALGLDETQQQSIQTIIQQMQTNQRQFFAAQRQQQQTMFGGGPNGGFDRQKMQDYFQSAAGKAQMDQTRQTMDKNRQATMKEIGRQLTKRQKSVYNQLTGPPFDLTLLTPAGFGGRGGPNGRNGNGQTRNNQTAANADEEDSEDAPAATAPAPSRTSRNAARSTTATKSARSNSRSTNNSLRARRNLGDSDE